MFSKESSVNPVDIETVLTEAREKLTDDDKVFVKSIITRAAQAAVDGSETVSIETINPAVAAELLVVCNQHNRQLRLQRSREYARQMQNGQWRLQGQGFQFYGNGQLADGQHRLYGVVLSGITIRAVIFFGLSEDAVDTIDLVTKRTVGDALTLEGIENSEEKANVFRAANVYLRKLDLGFPDKSVHEIKERIKAEDKTLAQAIIIGLASQAHILSPVVDLTFAAAIAYVLLKANWPQKDVQEHLAYFQAEDSSRGASHPLTVAADVISTARKIEKLSRPVEWQIIMKALILTHKGVATAKANAFTDIKGTPDPSTMTA